MGTHTSYLDSTSYSMRSDYFATGQSYPRELWERLAGGGGDIFIVTADELRVWKWSVKETERQWADTPTVYSSPSPTNNPWEIFQITFYICLDCWFIKDVFTGFTTQTTLPYFFFNKEKDWRCEYSISSIFTNGCVQYKTPSAANTVYVGMLGSSGYTGKTVTFPKEIWSNAFTCSLPSSSTS